MSSNESFGFRVQQRDRRGRFNFADRAHEAAPSDWFVSLPHQCSDWMISPEDEYDTGEVASHEAAVARLEAFIIEAQEALKALKDRREFGQDS